MKYQSTTNCLPILALSKYLNTRQVFQRTCLILFVGLVGCAATPLGAKSAQEIAVEKTNRETIVSAMQQELQRSMIHLQMDDYQPPYFLAYQLKELTGWSIAGKFGAIISEDNTHRRDIYVETRVGDYSFDNFAGIEGENYRYSDFRVQRRASLDSDEAALRGTLWLLTDESYKKALSDYLSKRGGAVFATQDKLDVPNFSREDSNTFRGPVTSLQRNTEYWQKIVREMTARLKKADFLMDSSMEVSGNRIVRYLVNSEGTNIVDEQIIYSIHIQAWTRADDGMLLENGRMLYARTPEQLPDRATLIGEIDAVIQELDALRVAPVINPYTGPAILESEAAGVLFHEAVGHRLEGERQRDEQEGRTFKGRIGKTVIPEFLSVYDDPTLDAFEGTELNGFYTYDDEGIEAQKATLIEHGILRGFLMSRTPVEGFMQSNGHGRAQGVFKPRARMSNLLVRANEQKSVSADHLKEMLIEEVKRQNKPYGLIIRDITGGSTNTLGYGYQAFKGIPRLIYTVDPDTGEETLIRGVELVGTPLSSINKIIAASDNYGIFNGYCGAESGYVPVSTIAPALLTTEVELQRSQQGREKAPILPPPWHDHETSTMPTQTAKQ